MKGGNARTKQLQSLRTIRDQQELQTRTASPKNNLKGPHYLQTYIKEVNQI